MNLLSTISGTHFLVGYGLALVAANLWASARWRAHQRAVSTSDPVEIDDPCEIAFLAGGARRVAQLATIRLLAAGRVEWIPKWSGPRLVADPSAEPAGSLTPLETEIFSLVRARGSKGLPANQLIQGVAPLLRPVEVRLATLGLRPTSSERASGAFATIWPLLLLIGIGIIRIAIGLGRDRPVGFLIAGVILAVISAVFWGKRGGYLTAAGRHRLDALRERHRDRQSLRFDNPSAHLPEIALGVALFGPASVASLLGYGSIHREIQSHIGASGGSSAGSDTSGCGSGCSSGCGGGCGGCGGD